MKLIAPAPVYPQSPADKAAHFEATGPIRVHNGDSDPDMDEALRRVRGDSDINEALHRLQTEIAYIERDAQLDAEVAQDIAAKDNWIPYVPPATPASPVEDYWDDVIDAYGTRRLPMTLSAA